MLRKRRQNGFTLIEMILVLIIVGILAALAGLGIVTGVQGYLFSKDNAAVSEKAQLALARINRELLECYDCVTATNNAPLNGVAFSNTLGSRYIYRSSAGNIEICPGSASNCDILMDNVSTFSMTYSSNVALDKSIGISIQSSIQPGGVTIPAFTSIVYPRNTP